MNLRISHFTGVVAVLLLATSVFSQSALADSKTEASVREAIVEAYAYGRKNLRDKENTVAKAGALHFWSSGGLLQRVSPDAPLASYESNSLTPKHIEVLTIDPGKSAVAMYYAEGSFQDKGRPAVSSYLTRVTEVMVKEGGKWKVLAAHYSPVAGGSGTNQNAVD
ncbi:MAG: nuclear transport factor 2 family protein [Gammaproteobacteria bacterium]|nr:nuclear transport factor 2 family protein [Gammaproteobacteria bacterium]